MLKRYQRLIGGIFRLVDGSVVGIAWIAAFWLRFEFPLFAVTKGFPSFGKYAALTPLVVILWMFVFSAMKIYGSHRLLRRTHEVQLILRGHLVSLLLFIAITYLVSEYKYSRAVILYFGVLTGVLLVLLRLTLRNLLREVRRRGFNLRHVLLVGDSSVMRVLIHKIERFPELGVRVLGVMGQVPSATFGKVYLGPFDQIRDAVRQHRPDQVLIALSRSQTPELDRILELLKNEAVDIQLIPDIHEYVTLGCEVEDFDGIPVVNLNDSPLIGWGALAKRLTDIFLSLVALVVLLPLLLLIAIAIKLTSRGGVLYYQERMGLDQRTFRMVKFRSMQQDAERQSGAVWASAGDARRTGLGAFLRKTSLDELPQLWNVLKGEMSLVGPRPERPVFVEKFQDDIPHYMLRHKVKAGMTGWAQVNGWRGNTSLNSRIECDLYYIRNWSYLLDIKIIFMTLWKGFINRNAY